MRDDEVWNHETLASWSSRPSLLSFPRSLSLLFCSNNRRRSRHAFSILSLDTLLLELQADEWPVLYSLPPAFSLEIQMTDLGCRLGWLASSIARSSVEESRGAPLPPTGTRDPRRPRDVCLARSTSIIIKEVPHERSCSHLFPLAYDTLVTAARISLLR